MKDQILDILCEHDQDPYGVDMSGKRKININKAATDIEQFMCYREVRAYLTGMGFEYFKRFPSITVDTIKHHLQKDYPESMITAAIERVKNENK